MPSMKDSSNHETLGGMMKKKPPMAHSMPGSTSHPEEALGGMAKKKVAPGHVGHRSTSQPDEALSQNPKKQIPSSGGGGVSDDSY